MFIRAKKSGNHVYLQIVDNVRVGLKVEQRVVQSLGRLDRLRESGQLDSLIRSGCNFSLKCSVLDAHACGRSLTRHTRRIGPSLVFERLWSDLKINEQIERLLKGRKFGFSVERALFLTVLHRLFASGSDREAHKWKDDYLIAGTGKLALHHLYRAMAWLGETLDSQSGSGATGARRTKDEIEEGLFALRRDLFTGLEIVFFDTTSIYFEGEGGHEIGRHGHSKDHRPDLKQMVVGMVLDSNGRPICCEMWPGNTADAKTLVPVASRLQQRFGVTSVAIVADRGMVSNATISELEKLGWQYILGARMRSSNEVKLQVVGRAGRYREVHPKSPDPKAPSPLKVKEVWVDEHRYVVCLNEDQATKDRLDRDAIVKALTDALKKGDKSLVGNQGFRRYLRTSREPFSIDKEKIKLEERYDGKWVLRTNMSLSAAETALKYKQLWMVEDIFRTMKSVLETRPVYHKCDETILGHVFCSFLSLVVRKELQERLESKGMRLEWADIQRDVDGLQETQFDLDGKSYVLRSQTKGVLGKVAHAVGVALPPDLHEGKIDP